MNKQSLTETEVRSRHIRPAIVKAGWEDWQIGEEKSFTAGRINVRGKIVTRGEKKRADFILYYKNNFPIAIIEAKDNSHRVGDGLQQALGYAETLDIPFVYSSNGEGFIERDRITEGATEREVTINEFPTPETLYSRYTKAKGITSEEETIVLQEYYTDVSSREPRYYQQVAINRVMSAVAQDQKRILLVMATGTGKTYTSFQIIWRLWKSRTKKRILFLVDRSALATQTMQGDFRHFGDAMTQIKKNVDKSYEVYVALYQGLTVEKNADDGSEETKSLLFEEFSRDFFDLIVVDECHRGSARANSSWREVLEYFSSATQIGLTATPKETTDISTEEYFGKSIYTYSLKQGIEDGYLAPYKVIRYVLDKDIEWRPETHVVDQHGNPIEDRYYGTADYDRNLVVKARTKLVAKKIIEFVRETDPMQKTIIFCVDIDHAERMRQELVNLSPYEVKKNWRYVVRITGDNEEGKNEIENLINPESPYPVLVTTSKLLTTGIDAQTCKLIVLDAPLNSMTEFKQIIGRGTRINEDYGKYYFTIMDFRGVTRLFADDDFDGPAIKIYEPENEKYQKGFDKLAEDETPTTIDPREEILIDPTEIIEPREKVIVADGVTFNVATKTIQYIDPLTGKLTTEALTDYSKKTILLEYATLDHFLTNWNKDTKKEAIIRELEKKGIAFDELKKEVGNNIDEFDLILHLAFNRKPMTRSERAKKAKASNVFQKYEGKARQILESLVDKYTDAGILAIDGIEDLQVSPFTEYGTPMEIVLYFGGRDQYLNAVREVQTELYSAV